MSLEHTNTFTIPLPQSVVDANWEALLAIGVDPSKPKGTIVGSGVHLDYTYDGSQVTFIITKKPFFIAFSKVESTIREKVEAAIRNL